MPRSGRPRGGEGPARRAPLPHGIAGARRPPSALHLVANDRPQPSTGCAPRIVRMVRPRPPLLTERAAVADAIAHAHAHAPMTNPVPVPLGGPSAEERARHLRAAYESSLDDGQREMIAEIMTHFRDWCEAHALGDPFRA